MGQQALWDGRYRRIREQAGEGVDDPWLDAFLPSLRPRGDGTALDLGCGAGGNARRLLAEGFSVQAGDFSAEAISLLSQRAPAISAFRFDMTGPWPAAIGPVDVIVASLSTHYFPWAKTQALYRRIHDALLPGGLFVLRVNSVKELSQRDAPLVKEALEADYYLLEDGSTKRYFRPETLAPLLEGFAVLHLAEGASDYHGHRKHYVQALVKRAESP